MARRRWRIRLSGTFAGSTARCCSAALISRPRLLSRAQRALPRVCLTDALTLFTLARIGNQRSRSRGDDLAGDAATIAESVSLRRRARSAVANTARRRALRTRGTLHGCGYIEGFARRVMQLMA